VKTTYQIVLALGALSLDIMALLGWMKLLRRSLSSWRSFLGVASILLTFLTMMTFFIPMTTRLTGFDARFLLVSWDAAIPILVALGVFSGCALARTPRIQVVAANVLLVALWRASMVY
jgi:hypothetical protein